MQVCIIVAFVGAVIIVVVVVNADSLNERLTDDCQIALWLPLVDLRCYLYVIVFVVVVNIVVVAVVAIAVAIEAFIRHN